MLAGGLVRGLGELADQLLEEVAHLGVRHRVGVEVDFGELRDDLEEPVLLVHGVDFVDELEALEDIDVGREAADVIDQVGAQVVRVLGEVGQAVVGGVEEVEAVLLAHLPRQRLRVRLLGSQSPDLVTSRLQDAVEPPQDRHRQDHVAVLMRPVGPTKLVGDRPHETSQLAQTSPP